MYVSLYTSVSIFIHFYMYLPVSLLLFLTYFPSYRPSHPFCHSYHYPLSSLLTLPPFALWQCQSQAWVKEEGYSKCCKIATNSLPIHSSISHFICFLLSFRSSSEETQNILRGHPFMTSTRRRKGSGSGGCLWTGRGGNHHVDVHTEN